MCSSSKVICAICVSWISNFILSIVIMIFAGYFKTRPRSDSEDAALDKWRETIIKWETLSENYSKGAHYQQYFRKEPVSITAAVGSEITLQCEVENQSGQVQWTKDGYALGFSRTIPGFPRYSFYADESRGTFNLNIQNVNLEDDGEFQCQVGPAIVPIIHKPIRAGANLTVLSSPSSIEIVGRENNSKLEVREHHSIVLHCLAKNAKPAARIVWFRGRTEIKPDSLEYNVTESESTSRRRTKIHLYDVMSEIHLHPSLEDDGVHYTCEAIHDALPPGKHLRASIQLSVLYPPGLPYIKGYGEGEILRRGQNVELVCQSRGGNPPAQLVWYKNSEQVKAIYRTIGRVSENVYTFVADMSDNKARFTCEASSVINRTRLTSEVNLTVYYPAATVIINGSTLARAGEAIPLYCTAGPSNPPVSIKWVVDGKTVENTPTKTVVAQDNGWITYSNTTVFVEANKTSVVAICYALYDQIDDNKMVTHTITVLSPPGEPEMEIVGGEKFITAGSQQTLICSSSGGNPLPTFKWFRNDREIPSNNRILENMMMVSEIKLYINASDNEAIFKCEVENPAIDVPYTKTVKFPVYFAPMQAKISKKPNDLKTGSTGSLICDVGASNPEPELSWWTDGLEVIENITKSCRNGLYGGRVCTSELSLSLTADMDGRRYTCQATNLALQLSASDVMKLNVHYKPSIAPLNETVFSEMEGYSLTIPLHISANPSKLNYRWTKDGQALAQDFDSTFNITHLRRNDSGLYSCEASNHMGSATISFRVAVLYAASIVHITDVVLAGERESASLECTVDGNPLTEEHVTWKREGFAMETKTNFSFRNITSFLTVHNVAYEDMGSFYCVVDNGIGNESSEAAYLIVKHKPVIDLSEPLMKAAAQVGSTAKLICKASGAPKIAFSWSKRGVVLSNQTNSDNRFSVVSEQTSIIDYVSTLYIQSVNIGDYDKYGCTARNSVGFTTHTVKLQALTAPDPPFQLTMVNATHDSITISWKPGFDGGDPPNYRVRYSLSHSGGKSSRFKDVGSVNVLTLQDLQLASCYLFNVAAHNKYGSSNYMRSDLRACSLSEGPPSLPSRGEVSTDDTNKLPFAVGMTVIFLLILLNVAVVIFCMVRRSRSKYTANSPQTTNKSENTDLYSSTNFNDQMRAESITSASEKSENYDKNYNMEGGRCSALNTYLIEEIDYPFQDTSAYEIEVKAEKLNAYHMTSTLGRNGSVPVCQRMDTSNSNFADEDSTHFVMYPPPLQFAQPPLQYSSHQRGHVPGPPPDVTVQAAQSVPLSTFNYVCNSEHDGQLV